MNAQRPVGAIVLAAGLGTRMKSSQAKVLHRLGGRPLITYPLAALREVGVDPIVVVVGHQADAVRAACAPYNVRVALQSEQKGTGHAARMAEPALEGFCGDVLLVYGDLPFLRPDTLRRLIAAHQEGRAQVSLLTATVDEPSDFGRIVRDERGQVMGIVENRDATDAQKRIREINVGLYCADTDFLFRALDQLAPTNAQAELYLTDIIALARAHGARVADAAAAASEGAQISSRIDLAAREKTLRDEINTQWMAAGVTLEDPATAYIGPDVRIGRDTIIGPNVMLRGATRIGDACRLDGSALITDAIIGSDVHVKFGVVITEATIEDHVQVGPFAQLRPGTHLSASVHVGDFVETKNATVGAGTKAMHHAYLGDVEIGRDANIGAGTIICNYDGFRKQRTRIGHRVQVGSDSQLVAPVDVGDDAYIATGTTVRKDVPPGALVFNSKMQMHREGWVAARRAREGVADLGATRGQLPAASSRAQRRRPSKKKSAARGGKVPRRLTRATPRVSARRKKRRARR